MKFENWTKFAMYDVCENYLKLTKYGKNDIAAVDASIIYRGSFQYFSRVVTFNFKLLVG